MAAPSTAQPLSGGSADTVDDLAKFGVVTISDRASSGVYQDLSGPAILGFFSEAIKSRWQAVYRVIPDEQPLIEQTLRELCDTEQCCLVVTTGGTGPAPRDVTPEATEAVCDRMMPGYGEQMRAISLKFVPTAVLSRQTAGLRGKSLIINLPGKPKSIRETFDEVFQSVPACIDLIEGPYIETNDSVVKAFRPAALVPKGSTVMQACDAAGIDIPRFCYHQKLSIAGNCRMCLVEVEKSPKPVASCAMPAGPGMKIKTDTPLVKKAREGVMEFLLINHPLDCPICDQGGECDLQDQAMHYGSDRGRFVEMKRSVDDKNLGPLVKTVMTRCIHCTRCIRFATEIAGVQELGVTGRGRDSEIGTYVEKLLTSELSGNVIDLCPVGALTSKPAAFTYRNWELKSTESIDTSDALGASIRVDSRGTEVMRIIPRNNEEVNEDWISDKARFQYDGLKRQRLNIPLVKDEQGAFTSALWPEALTKVGEALGKAKGNEIKAIAGKLTDAETLISAKDLLNRLGSGNLHMEGGFPDMDADVRSNYVMNTTLLGTEASDNILLVGSNPRVEAPVFNARIRKTTLEGTPVSVIGEDVDLTYPTNYLGAGADALDKALKDDKFIEGFKKAKHPMVVVGPGILKRADRGAVLAKVHELVEKAEVVRPGWNGYNIMHDSAARVAALDVGFLPSVSASQAPPAKVVLLLGSDDYQKEDIPQGAFVIYMGSHGDRGAARADVILPAAAYTEKAVTYVNMEGRVQRTKEAVPMPGDAREDWKILRAISEVVEKPLPYDTVRQVRQRLAEVAPHFARFDHVEQPLWLNGEYFKAFAERVLKGKADKAPFKSSVENFYQTDAISRSSQVMAKCVVARQKMPTRFQKYA